MTTVTIALIVGGVVVGAALVWLMARSRQTPQSHSPAPFVLPNPEPPRQPPVDQAVANILASAAAQPDDSRTNDDLVDDALRIVTSLGGVSVPALQRKLKIGFDRAGELVALLEERGYVSEPAANHKRKVLPSAFERVATLDEAE